MLHFDILTLFPGLFAGVFDESIVKRAREAGLVSISLHNIRDYGIGRHQVTDDTPYGGGGGMIMKPEPIFAAVEAVLGETAGDVPVILLTPQGRRFTQEIARQFAAPAAPAAHLRALRGRGRAGPPPPGHRRAVHRRLRAGRRRDPGHGRRRGGHAAHPRRAGRSVGHVRGFARRGAAGVPPLHPAAGLSRTRPCPRCCSPGITPRSSAGGGARRCAALGNAAPTS